MDHFVFVLIWLISVIFIPLCFWIPLVYKKSTYYCIAEFLLNGSLTIYVMMSFDNYIGLLVVISDFDDCLSSRKASILDAASLAFFPIYRFFYQKEFCPIIVHTFLFLIIGFYVLLDLD